MRAPRGVPAALAGAVLVLSACGGGSTATAPPPATTSDGAAAGSPQAGPRALSVRLVVSGGLGGSREVYEVTRADTGATRALSVAGSASLYDYSGEQLVGPAPCCDLRVYDLTVRYADGTTTRVRTAQTMPAPPELHRIVALVTRSGR